jgi:alkylhydroperoxidase/carboxymuconolactone decarboxylase family protein YurZ
MGSLLAYLWWVAVTPWAACLVVVTVCVVQDVRARRFAWFAELWRVEASRMSGLDREERALVMIGATTAVGALACLVVNGAALLVAGR